MISFRRFNRGDRVRLDDGLHATVMQVEEKLPQSTHDLLYEGNEPGGGVFYYVATDDNNPADETTWVLVGDADLSRLHWRDDDRHVMRSYTLSSNNVRLILDALHYYRQHGCNTGSLEDEHARVVEQVLRIETEHGDFVIEVRDE